MLSQILLIVLGMIGVVFFCAIPICWGRDCAAWQRAYGVSWREAYLRAVTVPAILLLTGFFLVPTADNRTWIFWLLVAGSAAAVVGVRWECHRYPEPPRVLRFWSEDDFPDGLPLDGYPCYECWKCSETKVGFWHYEATIQDKKKQEHAFAWMPVCDTCAQKASGDGFLKTALRRNLTDGPFYAAFLKATNSVLVAAMRWALSSR